MVFITRVKIFHKRKKFAKNIRAQYDAMNNFFFFLIILIDNKITK